VPRCIDSERKRPQCRVNASRYEILVVQAVKRSRDSTRGSTAFDKSYAPFLCHSSTAPPPLPMKRSGTREITKRKATALSSHHQFSHIHCLRCREVPRIEAADGKAVTDLGRPPEAERIQNCRNTQMNKLFRTIRSQIASPAAENGILQKASSLHYMCTLQAHNT
jgi:hypothetical protein